MNIWNKFLSTLWDLFCISSIIGIWPRFIEPRLLKTTRIQVTSALGKKSSLRILQISDLHWSKTTLNSLIPTIENQIKNLKPDLIVLTGDLICFGQVEDVARMQGFLQLLQAPLGAFVVLGNHDYNSYIGINENGDYDILKKSSSLLLKAFKLLFKTTKISSRYSKTVNQVKPNSDLIALLKKCAIEVLHNQTVQVGEICNLTGLAEHMSGLANPKEAFLNYNPNLPGIILAHNPDLFPLLKSFPGELVLSGHTHGGQVNLPWFWKKFSVTEYPQYKSGLFSESNKNLYVSRGVGGVMRFRWNSIPELVCIDLIKGN